jgi:Chloroplast import apparatus Tic20-like
MQLGCVGFHTTGPFKSQRIHKTITWKRPLSYFSDSIRSLGADYFATRMLFERRSSSFVTSTSRVNGKSALLGMWSQDDEIEGSDRIKACIPYLLPLIDGDHFGQYIYQRFPVLGMIDDVTIGPLAEWGHNIPFLSLGLFIALTLGTRFNSSMSRNLRFSAQQAALIDVALLFPELIASGFAEDPVPRYIVEPCCNFVWYAYMSAVLYCIISNIRGKKPDQIPYLSNSAELMVGPF